jgi:ABC-type branched-subunit amino acid transport system substrate-binding protein
MSQPFMSTAPLMEGEVPQKGGKAVEGTFSGTVWDRSDDSAKSKQFVTAYAKAQQALYPGEFTKIPDYYAANAYDAVSITGNKG